MIRARPMLVPPEAFVALAVAAALVVAVAVVEVVVFIRGAAATRLPARFLGLIVVGIALGLAHGALEWVDPALAGVGVPVATAVIVAVLILTLAVAAQPARNPLFVALLGAGLLYQFGWLGGRFVVPDVPVIGDALGDARCQRDPYCRPPSLVTTAQVELRIELPTSDVTAQGEISCHVDPRPIAMEQLTLWGTLNTEGGDDIPIDVRVAQADSLGVMPEPGIYFYLEGAMGGFEAVSGEAHGLTWSPTASDSARAGTITFDQMLMERIRPGEDLWSQEHAFDDAHGTLTWECR